MPLPVPAHCISRLNADKAQARLTVFEGAGHRDVPALAWLDEELGLLSWMLAQQRFIRLAEGDSPICRQPAIGREEKRG